MPIVLNGSGPITGVTSLNTTVSDTEIGYLDGVTSALQTQINTAGGLVKITDASVSAAASISVNNCFSATYRNYMVIGRLQGSGTATAMNMRMRLSGTDATGANYNCQYLSVESTSLIASRATGTTSGEIVATDSTGGTFISTVYNPFVAERTRWISQGLVRETTSITTAFVGTTHDVATAYDGFTLTAGSGNLTGTIRIYGIRD